MSEASLTHAELHEQVHSVGFISRIGLLATQATRMGYEGSFALFKSLGHVSQGQAHLPTSEKDNADRDPKTTIGIEAALPKGIWDNPTLAAFFHIHPGLPFGDNEIIRYPSPADLQCQRHAHRVNPGHIGGILVALTAPPAAILFLYRPDQATFNPELLPKETPANITAAEYLVSIESAGIRHASIGYMAGNDYPTNAQALTKLFG